MAVAILLSCTSLRADDAAPAVRVWRDLSGRAELVGAFVEMQDAAVSIRRKDGRMFVIPVGWLSKEDRDFLAKVAQPLPQTTVAEKPLILPSKQISDFPRALVGTCWEQGPQRFSTGIVVHQDKDAAYVLMMFSNKLPGGTWEFASTLEATKSSFEVHTADGASPLPVKRAWVYKNGAALLRVRMQDPPEPIDLEADVEVTEGDQVRVTGYDIDRSSQPPSYTPVTVQATIARVVLNDKELAPSIFIRGQKDLLRVKTGVVLSNGRPIGCFWEARQPTESRGEVMLHLNPLASLRDHVRGEFQDAAAAVLTNERDLKASYEFVIHVQDPLENVRDPRLLIKKLPLKPYPVPHRTIGEWTPFDDEVDRILLEKKSPSEEAQEFLDISRVITGAPLVCRFEYTHKREELLGGHPHHHFVVQVEYTDATGNTRYSPPMRVGGKTVRRPLQR